LDQPIARQDVEPAVRVRLKQRLNRVLKHHHIDRRNVLYFSDPENNVQGINHEIDTLFLAIVKIREGRGEEGIKSSGGAYVIVTVPS
jgi:hypothetical protein